MTNRAELIDEVGVNGAEILDAQTKQIEQLKAKIDAFAKQGAQQSQTNVPAPMEIPPFSSAVPVSPPMQPQVPGQPPSVQPMVAPVAQPPVAPASSVPVPPSQLAPAPTQAPANNIPQQQPLPTDSVAVEEMIYAANIPAYNQTNIDPKFKAFMGAPDPSSRLNETYGNILEKSKQSKNLAAVQSIYQDFHNSQQQAQNSVAGYQAPANTSLQPAGAPINQLPAMAQEEGPMSPQELMGMYKKIGNKFKDDEVAGRPPTPQTKMFVSEVQHKMNTAPGGFQDMGWNYRSSKTVT